MIKLNCLSFFQSFSGYLKILTSKKMSCITVSIKCYCLKQTHYQEKFGVYTFWLFFLQIFFPMSGMSRMISVGFAVLYCMYIIYDTGLIMERLTPDEYIIAPAILYMDMVALFLRLLKLRGERERRNDQNKDFFPSTRSDYYTNKIYFFGLLC